MTTPFRREGYRKAIMKMFKVMAERDAVFAEYDVSSHGDPHDLDRMVAQINKLNAAVEEARKAVAFWKSMGGDK